MDPNTIAYRWARFQVVLNGLELPDDESSDKTGSANDCVANLHERAILEFAIGDEANDDWLGDNL